MYFVALAEWVLPTAAAPCPLDGSPPFSPPRVYVSKHVCVCVCIVCVCLHVRVGLVSVCVHVRVGLVG